MINSTGLRAVCYRVNLSRDAAAAVAVVPTGTLMQSMGKNPHVRMYGAPKRVKSHFRASVLLPTLRELRIHKKKHVTLNRSTAHEKVLEHR